MKRMTSMLVALAIAGAAAVATGTTNLPEAGVTHALTTIDSVPTKSQLTHVFGGDPVLALQSLATLAKDPAGDYGVRLRAIHALAKYCPEPCSTSESAHVALTDLIAAHRQELSGPNLLLLRAAIETLGTLQVSSDVTVLVALLDHPSRDIRAATARALRDLCNTQAITPLRVRYTSEPTEQVKLAISEALRILGQCSQT